MLIGNKYDLAEHKRNVETSTGQQVSVTMIDNQCNIFISNLNPRNPVKILHGHCAYMCSVNTTVTRL